MKHISRFGTGLVLMFSFGTLLSGCEDKDPVACFTVPSTLVDAYQDVQISNCAYIPSNGYIDWDMGDGTTYDNVQATHAYTAQGTYTMKQNAYGKNGSRVDTHTEVITVGRRIFTGYTVTALPPNPNGGDWDPSDNIPEVALHIYKGTTPYYQSPSGQAVPFTENVASPSLELTPENWSFFVLDLDVLPDVHDTIVAMHYDLNTAVFNHQVPSEPGFHRVQQGGIDLEIRYDVVQ